MLTFKIFSPTITDLAQRYIDTLPHNHHAAYRAKTLQKHLGSIRISKLQPEHIRDFMRARAHLSAQSITHELNCLKAIIRTARQEWGLDIPDHKKTFSRVAMPSVRNARERRLQDGEWQALWAEASPMMRLSMTMAVETAMRREEMVQVRREWVDLGNRVIRLPAEVTKTKRARDVPLSIEAAAAIGPHLSGGPGLLLGWSNNAHRLAWHRTRDRAMMACPSVATFHWHDFRHEAISRYAARGWEISLLKGVSGHADNRMLLRYVNLTAREVIAKMDEGRGA